MSTNKAIALADELEAAQRDCAAWEANYRELQRALAQMRAERDSQCCYCGKAIIYFVEKGQHEDGRVFHGKCLRERDTLTAERDTLKGLLEASVIELTLHDHRTIAQHNEGQAGMPQGECSCVVCRPFYDERDTLARQCAAKDAALEKAKAAIEKIHPYYMAALEGELSSTLRIVCAALSPDAGKDIKA